MADLIGHDLDCILAQTSEAWEQMRGGRLFVTGGTGFFGNWMVESFLHANRTLGLKATLVLLTRDPEAVRASRPHLFRNPYVTLHGGDVRTFEFPAGQFTHIVHAATPASAELNARNPLAMLDTIVEGTRRVLDFAVACEARRFLLTSSGAVYGPQRSGVSHQPEDRPGGPDTMNPQSAYAEGKRLAELLCSIYSASYGLETLIARCFAFVGPYLPLNAHFAVGNFIQDQLKGGPIQVKGDGTTVRSYLYAADLAAWLWTILFQGEACRPYNVGSDEAISIRDLAHMVGQLDPNVPVEIAGSTVPGKQPDRYVPDVSRIVDELGVRQTVGLEEALRRTSRWNMLTSIHEPGNSAAPRQDALLMGAVA